MEIFKVKHMKSIPSIANHMLAHDFQYLMLLLYKCFQLSRMYEQKASKLAAASLATLGTKDRPKNNTPR